MDDELDRLITAKSILETSEILVEEDKLRRMSLYINGGMPPDVILRMLKPTQSDRTLCFSICDALLEISGIYDLSPEHMITLGTVVANSGLGTAGIDALPSLFLKARVSRIPTDDVISLVTTALSKDGGIVAIDRELERRRIDR